MKPARTTAILNLKGGDPKPGNLAQVLRLPGDDPAPGDFALGCVQATAYALAQMKPEWQQAIWKRWKNRIGQLTEYTIRRFQSDFTSIENLQCPERSGCVHTAVGGGMTVTQKQCLLKYLGYYPGQVDGIWGQASIQATKDLQTAHGLDQDGVFGDDTLTAAKADVAADRFKAQEPEQPQADTAPDWWPEIRYFRREDAGIRCPCGRCGGFPVEPSQELMRAADKIRAHFGRAMIPSSTVRCQAHNDELPGSAKNSLHIQGRAMDFDIVGISAAETLAYTQQLVSQGELHYTYEMPGTGYVHIDI